MTEQTVFIHLGFHKTGSTSIQVSLTRSRDRLRDNGILYPQVGVPSVAPYGHHELPWAVMRETSYRPTFGGEKYQPSQSEIGQIFEDLDREIEQSGCSRIIISSEEFDTLKKDEIFDVVEKIGNGRRRIVPIVFLRRTDDFLDSSFKTSVMNGYTRNIIDFSENQRSRLDCYEYVLEWSRCSQSIVEVIDYDDAAIRQNVVRPFADIIGIPNSCFVGHVERFENKSVSAEVCEIVRFLRLKGASQKVAADWVRRLEDGGFGQSKGNRQATSLLSDAARAELLSNYRAEIAQMVEGGNEHLRLHGAFKPDDVTPRNYIDNVVKAILALQ